MSIEIYKVASKKQNRFQIKLLIISTIRLLPPIQLEQERFPLCVVGDALVDVPLGDGAGLERGETGEKAVKDLLAFSIFILNNAESSCLSHIKYFLTVNYF